MEPDLPGSVPYDQLGACELWPLREGETVGEKG